MEKGVRGGCTGGQRRRWHSEAGVAYIGARRGWLGVLRSAFGVAAPVSLGAPRRLKWPVDHAQTQVRGPLRVSRDVAALAQVPLRWLAAAGVMLTVPVPVPPIMFGWSARRRPRAEMAICAGVGLPLAVGARTAKPRTHLSLARVGGKWVELAGRDFRGCIGQLIKRVVINEGVGPLLCRPLTDGQPRRLSEPVGRRRTTADTRRSGRGE